MHLAFGGLTLNADIGVSVTSTEVQIAGAHVNAGLSAGGVSIAETGGHFGLVVNNAGFGFESAGAFSLSGGSFASVTADSVALRMNHLGADLTARTLHFGSNFSYTFGTLGANVGLEASVIGLHAQVGGVLNISGDFAFESHTSDSTMNVVAQHANASLGAGDFIVGVSDASLGMHIGAFGTVFEAQGALDAHLGAQVSLTANTVSVRWNDTAQDYSNLAIDAGGLSYVFGAGLMSSVKEVSLAGANLNVGGFVQASGNLSIRRVAGVQVKLADGTTHTVNELIFGGSHLDAFAGVDGGTDHALGLKMSDVNLALVLLSEQSAPTHTWSALKASAASLEFVGLGAVTMAASDIVVNYNHVGLPTDSVVDFASVDRKSVV